jgi:hypothetical protein
MDTGSFLLGIGAGLCIAFFGMWAIAATTPRTVKPRTVKPRKRRA